MTNFERTLRGFDANLCCKCCLDMIKDLDHVFRFCIKIRLFFPSFVDDDYLCYTQQLSFMEWFS